MIRLEFGVVVTAVLRLRCLHVDIVYVEMLYSMPSSTFFMLEFRFIPSKHAGSDPEAFWFWPVMAITASVRPKLARIVYSGSDFPHPFGFRFSHEGMDQTVQKLTRILCGQTGQGLAKHIWSGSKLVCRNHRDRFLAGHNQFPTFRLGSVIPQTSRLILCKTSPDPTWFWLIVSGLGQADPIQKQANV